VKLALRATKALRVLRVQLEQLALRVIPALRELRVLKA
jgi:hypothetical protein